MTALHSAQVVHAVGEGESLRIGELFADLLYTTVYITEVRIEFGDDFTFQTGAEVQHSVGGGVLRTKVDDIIILSK